jgi:hypothetical protein
MDSIDKGRKHLVESRMVVAHGTADLEQLQCFLIPKTAEAMEVKIGEDGIGRQVACTLEAGATQTFELEERFHLVSIENVALAVATSQLSDCHLGDIKFFCCLIGMVNSDGCHCMCCRQVQSKWGAGKLEEQTMRTAANLDQDWKEFLNIVAEARQKGLKKKINNHACANACFLLDVELSQSLPPSLPCETGIINKFVNDSNRFIHAHVESLPTPETRCIWSEFLSATDMLREASVDNVRIKAELKAAKAERRRRQEVYKNLPNLAWTREHVKADKRR